MEIIIFLGLLMLIITAVQLRSTAQSSEKLIVEVKKCPLHDWKWQEVIDKDGVKQYDRIVCSRCGPLSKSLGQTE